MTLAACGGATDVPAKQPKTRPDGLGVGPALSGPPALDAVVVAELASTDTETYFARNGKNGMLVARARGRWLAGPVRLGSKDVVTGDGMHDVAAAPAEATRSALSADRDGFLLVWAMSAGAADELWGVALDANGAPREEAHKLTTVLDRILWLELASGEGGTFVALEVGPPPPGEAEPEPGDLYVLPWATHTVSKPTPIARGAAGWHAIGSPRGAAVAWVGDMNEDRGTVRFVEIGKDGAAQKPLTLSAPAALTDVQVQRVGDHYLVAWTDLGADDAHVVVAQVALGGDVTQPARAPLPPVGAQALVSLTASGDGKRALLAWEPQVGARAVRLAVLDESASPAPAQAVLELGAGDAPVFEPDGAGFAALTLAPLVVMNAEGAQPSPPLGPMFVRLDAELGVRGAEAIRVAELRGQGVIDGVPELVRTLDCQDDLCTVVAQGGGTPSLLLVVTLPARASGWQSPARLVAAQAPPLAAALDTVAGLDRPVGRVSSATLADGRTLVAWITHVADADADAEHGATLACRFVAADGTLGPVTVVSERAISSGGVRVAALPPAGKAKKRGVAVLAWSGPNNGAAQVFLTEIGADGAKVKQKAFTKVGAKKGGPAHEVLDIDLIADDKGELVVAWSDIRDVEPAEIWVARADAELDRRGNERRVTDSPGPAAEPALAHAGDGVLLAWAGDPLVTGRTDVFVRVLDASLAPAGAETKLDESSASSRTPQWAGADRQSVTLAWIDEATAEDRGGVRLVALDPSARPITAVRRIGVGSGAEPTSATVRCDAQRCRGVVSGKQEGITVLGAFGTEREGGASVTAATLVELAGATTQDLSLAAADPAVGSVFFVHDAGGGARIRRLAVRW
jgi:hypothetical protein